MDEIRSRVKEIIAELCDVPLSEVRDEGLLLGYGLDSVRAVDLIASLETELGIVVPDAELAEIRTVGDVVSKVARLRG